MTTFYRCSWGVDNGRDSNDKNVVEDIVAKNCFQANLVMSVKLGDSCCRE